MKLTTDAPARATAMCCWPAIRTCSTVGRAGQELARDLILARAAGTPDEVAEERYATAVGRGLDDQSADEAFKALLLTPAQRVGPRPGGVARRPGGDP